MQSEPPQADPPNRKRRWFQFSLCKPIISTVLCAFRQELLEKQFAEPKLQVTETFFCGGCVMYRYVRPVSYLASAFWIAFGTMVWAAERQPERLTWIHVQAALAAPESRTFGAFCVRVSKLPIDEKNRKRYADVSQREADFVSLDKYIANMYQQDALYQEAAKTGKDMSLPAIRKRLSSSIMWKTSTPVLEKVTRDYLLGTDPASDSEMIARDDPVWIDVFTDDRGTILGWRHSEVPAFSIIIIVNGHEKTVSGDSANRALIEVFAEPDETSPSPTEKRYAISYRDGPCANRHGTMAKDVTAAVKIRNGMIFDVKDDAE